MARLHITLPDGGVREHELEPDNRIGRHPEQSIQVLDRLVSKAHLVIRQVEGGWEVEDLGSLNGTYVNDERIEGKMPLCDRDVVRIGETRLVFRDEVSAVTGNHRVTIGDDLESAIREEARQSTADELAAAEEHDDEASLRQEYEKLRAAARLQQHISGKVQLDELLPELLDQLAHVFRFDRGVILLADEPGAELRARAVRVQRGDGEEGDSISISRTILQRVLDRRKGVLTNDALQDARFAHARSVITQGIRSSMCVPLLDRSLEVMGVVHLDSQQAVNAYTQHDLAMLQGIAQQASVAVENSRLAERMRQEALNREKLQKMLSPNLVERVLAGEIAIEKGGVRRPVTVMFTDIRGFTDLAERSRSEDLVRMLNEYFERIVDVIFECEGSLDKFMGDGVMAVWGAPVEVPEARAKALRAATKIQRTVESFNQVREMDGYAPIHTGIGLDAGQVVAGYMGSSKTMSYTVIGPCVNVASRLCVSAGPGEILATADVTEQAPDGVEVQEAEPRNLKGIREPVTPHRVRPAESNEV